MFINPPAVQTLTIAVERYSGGQVTQQATLRLDNFEALPMTAAELTPLSSVIGATDTELQFTVTLASALTDGGQVKLVTPSWFPSSASEVSSVFP